jgi:hypothetical protein
LVNETLVSNRRPKQRATDLINDAQFWGHKLAELDTYDVEPFLSDLFNHSSISSTYPPDRSRALFPTNIYFASWSSSSNDSEIAAALWQSTNTIQAAAIAEGQNITDVAVYGNYALIGTPIESLYGENLHRLRSIRSEVDPNNVMALAGGFKLQALILRMAQAARCSMTVRTFSELLSYIPYQSRHSPSCVTARDLLTIPCTLTI